METQEYKNIYKLEESHFFYKANHAIILDLIDFYIRRKGLKILDAGSGTGLLASKLKALGNVYAVDIHPEAVKYAKKRKIKVQKASITRLPFKNDYFDLVTCIDVLYHQRVNDRKALTEIIRVLKPGGLLIIRVAAIPWLKSSYDQFVHTRERYSKKSLQNILKKTGFQIHKLSYINLLLVPFAIINHVLEKVWIPEGHSPIKVQPKVINALFTQLLSWERYLIRAVDLPFGLGLIAVCSKPYSR